MQAGYYCNVCDCILRDSQSYLDHINGKYHNRALGMSMTVEKSTADDVRKKFESLKKDQDVPEAVDTVLDGMSHAVLCMQSACMTVEKNNADDVRKKFESFKKDQDVP